MIIASSKENKEEENCRPRHTNNEKKYCWPTLIFHIKFTFMLVVYCRKDHPEKVRKKAGGKIICTYAATNLVK